MIDLMRSRTSTFDPPQVARWGDSGADPMADLLRAKLDTATFRPAPQVLVMPLHRWRKIVRGVFYARRKKAGKGKRAWRRERGRRMERKTW